MTVTGVLARNKDELETRLGQLRKHFDKLECKYQSIGEVTELKQSDFDKGTYIISKPGVYKLTENIVFNPNSLDYLNRSSNDQLRADNGIPTPAEPYHSGDVLGTQFANKDYDPRAYGIGFFAAIAIEATDVVLNLNGYEISQSKEHALQQRFFAVIELASQPFLPSQGPHSFGSNIKSAANCYIKDGTLSTSSHHSVHGNLNKNIVLEDVKFKDFEVAGVALNEVQGLYMVNCDILHNRHDVPVLGTFSAARFLRSYINKLKQDNYDGTLLNKDIHTIHDNLRMAINNAYNQIDRKEWGKQDKNAEYTKEYNLFGNEPQVVDGVCYGILTNPRGVAVGGEPLTRNDASRYIYCKNVNVNGLKCSVNEVPALAQNDKQANDPRGALLQTQNRDPKGNLVTMTDAQEYTGNSVSDAQLILAQAIHRGHNFARLDVSRNSITPEMVKWANGDLSFTDAGFTYKCNGDSMFHVVKQGIGLKIDGTENVHLENVHVTNCSNSGAMGSDLANKTNSDYMNKVGVSHSGAVYKGYSGTSFRGFSFASSKNVLCDGCSCKNLQSSHGWVHGYSMHLNSRNIELCNCEALSLKAGTEADLDEYNSNPSHLPISVGFYVERRAKDVTMKNVHASDGMSPFAVYGKLIEE